jgi:hypothetical protein
MGGEEDRADYCPIFRLEGVRPCGLRGEERGLRVEGRVNQRSAPKRPCELPALPLGRTSWIAPEGDRR